MTLKDVLLRLDELDEEHTIYADGGPNAQLTAAAVVALEPEDGSLPADARSMTYLLEVGLATEIVDVWRRWRDGREPTVEERHEAVSYYAMHDAYLPA